MTVKKKVTGLSKIITLRIKAVAITAVIFLHTLTLFPDSIYTSNYFKLLFITLNQTARFCVPLFLALSGYGLSKKYGSKKLSPKKFLLKRIKKLIPLYFLWSIIFLIIFYISNSWFYSDANWLRSFFWGETDYHLYFIPLIFQFYFLFVFFPKIKKRQRLLTLTIIIGGIQALWLLLIRTSSLQQVSFTDFLTDDQLQYRLFTNWLFYFLFGGVLARFNLSKIRKIKYLKKILVVITLFGLTWAVYDSQVIIEKTNNIIYATSFTRLPVFIYSTGLIAILIIYGKKIFDRQTLKTPILASIGRHSYLIYLSHTLLLRILEGVFTGKPRMSTIALGTALFSTGVFLSKHLPG